MSRTLSFVSAAIALVAVATSSLAALTGITNKEIKCNGELLATVNFDVPTIFADNVGMPPRPRSGITISGNATKTNKLKGEIRWLQLIKTSDPVNTNTAAGTPYFDPGELDPSGNNFPFYWNENLKGRDGNNYPDFWVQNQFSNGGNTLAMYDQPKRFADTGKAIDWTAELSLVCWDKATGKIGVLWSANYGFNIAANGVGTAFGINEIAAPVWLTQASLDARYGKNTYSLSLDCQDCLVPAPGSLAFLAFSGVVAARRRRAA